MSGRRWPWISLFFVICRNVSNPQDQKVSPKQQRLGGLPGGMARRHLLCFPIYPWNNKRRLSAGASSKDQALSAYTPSCASCWPLRGVRDSVACPWTSHSSISCPEPLYRGKNQWSVEGDKLIGEFGEEYDDFDVPHDKTAKKDVYMTGCYHKVEVTRQYTVFFWDLVGWVGGQSNVKQSKAYTTECLRIYDRVFTRVYII